MPKLTALEIKNIDKPGSYGDLHHGLMLRVSKNGTKSWVQRIKIKGGKRVERGLGSIKLRSVKDARELATENYKLARRGIDPSSLKAETNQRINFKEATKAAHQELVDTYKNEKDYNAFLNSLKTYAWPKLGRRYVDEITSREIRTIVLALRAKKPELARKLEQRIRAVFKWTVSQEYRDSNPALPDVLALPKTQKRTQHQKSVPYQDVPQCLADIQATKAGLSTKYAIEFLILTAGRSKEIREAVWEEVDLTADQPVWVIPASRMKMKREHRVPLGERAVEILNELKPLSEFDHYIFEGSKPKRPLSDMTLLKLIKACGWDATIHGFRASFRTWAQEKANAMPGIAEAALAHSNQSAVEAAYARSDLFERRAQLMKDWEKFVLSRPM